MNKNIGIIGTGNIGSSLVKGFVLSKKIKPSSINIYDINTDKLRLLSKATKVNAVNSLEDIVNFSDIILLAVKPKLVDGVLDIIKPKLNSKKIIVSLAAGIPLKHYSEKLGDSVKIFRAMPNLAVSVLEGVTMISYDENVSKNEVEVITNIFECVGFVEKTDEYLMSSYIALTASSPAYVSMFIEAMADAAVFTGIPRNVSYKLAAKAILGASKMILSANLHPAELKDHVCTPSGTTIEAIRVLEKSAFRSSVIEAIISCTKKSEQLESKY